MVFLRNRAPRHRCEVALNLAGCVDRSHTNVIAVVLSPLSSKNCLGEIVFADVDRDPVLNFNDRGDHAASLELSAGCDGGWRAKVKEGIPQSEGTNC